MKKLFVYALFTSLLSLAAAFIAQYGFGLTPCELCIAQRVPYALITVISVGIIATGHYRKYLLYLIALLFIVDGGIATYHSAVEKHIVQGPVACTSSGGAAQTTDDLLRRIQNAPIVACDQPQWEFHGITMASMNAVWAFMLGFWILIRTRKEKYA